MEMQDKEVFPLTNILLTFKPELGCLQHKVAGSQRVGYRTGS